MGVVLRQVYGWGLFAIGPSLTNGSVEWNALPLNRGQQYTYLTRPFQSREVTCLSTSRTYNTQSHVGHTLCRYIILDLL
jgi:hypothetical protein